MRPIVIKVLIGAVGFAGGFAAGFFFHRKTTELKFEEITQEEMAAIEDAEAKKNDIPASDTKTKAEQSKVSDELGAAQELPETPDDIRNTLQGKTPYMQADKDTKTAYEKLWKATNEYSGVENANQYPVWKTSEVIEATKATEKGTDEAEEESPEEEDFDEEFLEQLEQEAAEAGNDFEEPSHQIDLVAFYNENPDWDSVTVKWFMDDNTWVDENDEVIPDIQSYTGIGVKNPFDEEPLDEDPDVRLWANSRYKTNYEFIRHHRSWAETTGEVN